MKTDLIVSRLEQAGHALAFVKEPRELKRLADLAQSAESYAKRQRLGDEVIGYATQIKTMALRKLGEVVQHGIDAGTIAGKGDRRKCSAKEHLADLGIDRKTSMIAQQLAKLPDELVQAVAERKVTVSQARRQVGETKRADDLARPVAITLPAGIHRGDFRELSSDIEDDSVDLIFTDPPYDGDSVQLYEDAARIAARILKPGASMIAYSGQRYLPDVLAGMSKHLRYWWTIAGVHEGGNQMLQKLGIRCGWKPLVWFVKDTRGDVQNVMLDVVRGDREKDAHEWQQSQIEAVQLIEKLCAPGGVVVDFCLGGGTTAVACKHLGRRFIGFEVNAQSLERSVERLAA